MQITVNLEVDLIVVYMDIFRDYSHQNVRTKIGDKDYLKKEVADKRILEREFRVL